MPKSKVINPSKRNTLCPFCNESIKNIQDHFNDHLSNFDNSLIAPSRHKPSSKSLKQSTLVKKIKNNRQKRSTNTSTPCFVCGQDLPKSQDEINAHIDYCLALNNQSEEAYEEEYTWAGVTRIRATTMIEGNFEDHGFIVNKSNPINEVEDVDIDSEDVYSGIGFNESDVVKYQVSEDTETFQEETTEQVSCDTSSLIITSLKSHINTIENGTSGPNCCVCMSAFVEPTVSVNCWHVLCSECWLKSLAFKRVCPCCQVIVAPTELRLIYF